jgi:uncharacterized protein YeaC (DUF1315 family)
MTGTTKPKHGKFQPKNKRISLQDAIKLFYAKHNINSHHRAIGSAYNLPGRSKKQIKP